LEAAFVIGSDTGNQTMIFFCEQSQASRYSANFFGRITSFSNYAARNASDR
jgi:hypothetical protein